MVEPAVRVDNLVKRYPTAVAVDGISFTVARGATAALLGGNGAGKTTTLSILLGLLLPTAGRVQVLGENILRHRYRVLPRMNFSSPFVDLPHRLTVRQNLLIYARLYGLQQRRERIERLAADLQISAFLERGCRLVEPDTGDWVRSYLESYRARTRATILMASHNMSEVERLCSEVMMMKAGRIVDRGSPRALIDRYGRTNLEEVFLHIAREPRIELEPVK